MGLTKMTVPKNPGAQHGAIKRRILIAGLLLLIALLVLSGWKPYDRLTWLMEVLPVMLVLPILYVSYPRFPLTKLLYTGIFLHCCVLMLGGAYTYARVPLGFELQELFDLNRNPYDKIGHFMQGFVPALAARELFIRHKVINGKAWLAFLVLCVVMFISAVYELIEWAAALVMGQGADEFLGTQGDVWDTQSDMFLALIGASCLLLFFSRWHDRQIHGLQKTNA
jgi:putative membrane protein